MVSLQSDPALTYLTLFGSVRNLVSQYDFYVQRENKKWTDALPLCFIFKKFRAFVKNAEKALDRPSVFRDAMENYL